MYRTTKVLSDLEEGHAKEDEALLNLSFPRSDVKGMELLSIPPPPRLTSLG
jgi:hypothetical protein